MAQFTLHLCVFLVVLLGLEGGASQEEPKRVFHNEWAVEIEGGERIARDVAEEYGFTFVKKIGTLENKYRLRRDDHHSRSKRQAIDATGLLDEDKRVLWVEQQETLFHVKRDAKALPHDATGDDYVPPFNDPMFPQQWYLHNQGQNRAQRGVDMNLAPAWKLGFMGKGVVVSIVDDGVDGTHSDLKNNFDPEASWDFNGNDGDPHPDDRPERGSENDHGTRCAGEVAAEANNGICGVGAAPEASIGGIRFLDGDVTDSMEADALTYHNQHVDIYSCCWGPSDSGKVMRVPGKLMGEALAEGTKKGRGGKGSIYTWASGNGGHNGDDCGADGYVGSIHTISVGSVNDEGESVYFMEKCSSTMAVVLSGGVSDDKSKRDYSKPQNLVITTDIHNGCIDNFIGTSSAAPLAAGVFALVLQANPNLTWRDLQHVVVHGAHIPNAEESGWHVNGAGFHTNEKFGFGMLDAGKMVELALTWRLVGPQQTYTTPTSRYHKIPQSILQGMSTVVSVDVNCPITRLEHTVARISYQAPRRGDVSLTLWSPQGTPSELLSVRKNDNTSQSVDEFPFMSVRNWGENPNGVWRLEVMHHHTPPEVLKGEQLPDIPRESSNTARFTGFVLTLYGTDDEADPTTTNEENPAVNPDLTGHIKDSNVLVDMYNKEQLDDEEIVIDKDQLAKGVEEPPNAKHNLDDEEDIDTGEFDGILKDPEVRALIEDFYIMRRAEMKRRFEERRRLQETRRNEYDDVMTDKGLEKRFHGEEVRSQGQVRSQSLGELRKDTIKELERLLKDRESGY